MTITRNGRWGIVAVAAVALVAAGAALAATQFHDSSTANGRGTGAFGGPGGPSAQGFVPRGDRAGDGFGFRRPGSDVSAAVSYLGLSEDDLVQQLQAGKTLAQIANATSGKSAAGLIDALVSTQQAQIAAAVRSGRLSQSLADRIIADLKARITDRVNGTFAPGRGGFGPPGGQAPQSSTPPTHI
jgi:hypothetical protein